MLNVSIDGTQLWASNRWNDNVSVIDTSDGHVITRIKVGNAPHGLTYFPQPGRFSLGHNVSIGEPAVAEATGIEKPRPFGRGSVC